MHDEGAGRGIAELGRHLMPDALSLMHRHALLGAPGACDAVQLFFLGGGRRHHVVDEQHEALGPFDLVHAELLARFAEEDIGVAGEVVADDEVGARLNLVTGLHEGPSAGAGEDLLGHRLGNAGCYYFHNMAIIQIRVLLLLHATRSSAGSSQTRRFAASWKLNRQHLATLDGSQT